MKLTRLLACIFVALLFAGVPAHAQSINSENLRQVRIDEISDADLKEYYQKALAAGLTESQVYKMVSDRGLPDAELVKLRQRVAMLSASAPVKTKDSASANLPSAKKDNIDRLVNDDAMKLPMQKIARDSTIFGSELFTESSLVFEPNLRIPSPGNYLLGPDDQLVVNVFGYSEQTYTVTVNAEGNIYIPNVGPIKVNGLSLDAASDRIKSRLAATIYKAIRTGQTKVEISLGRIRSVRVTVIGQASRPGTYTVSSLTTLFNLLYLCGGPSDRGSFRNIELIRGNKVVRTVDLYRFLMMGNRSDNVLLQEQDVIRVPYYSNRVSLEGAARRTGKFEMLSGENIASLLDYSGGFADSAYKASVQVRRLSDTGIVISDILQADFARFSPKTGDVYRVSSVAKRFLNRVSISGAVFRPGEYELKPGMTLKQLLEMAGGLKEDAFLERGLIQRQNADLTLASQFFGVGDVATGKTDLPLQREDIITVLSVLNLKDVPSVFIEGAVRAGGTFTFAKGLTVKDLVLKSGGFAENADLSRVELSRRLPNPDLKQENYKQTELQVIDLSQGLSSASGEMMLQPFDIVSVRYKAGYTNPRFVYVQGEVMNTGRYVLESSNERVSSILRRAGGFKGSADSNSVAIRRFVNSSLTAQERLNIVERMLNLKADSINGNARLRETFLKNVELLGIDAQKMREEPGGNDDLILENGDVITVSNASNLVRVNGEVFHPTLLPVDDSRSARYYIRLSGNFTPKARRNEVFVIYPDGKAKSVKSFLFFRHYPRITARSEIFVPAKNPEAKRPITTGEWIAISSILATFATLTVTIIQALK